MRLRDLVKKYGIKKLSTITGYSTDYLNSLRAGSIPKFEVSTFKGSSVPSATVAHKHINLKVKVYELAKDTVKLGVLRKFKK